MPNSTPLRSHAAILIGASVLLTMAMGLRQSLGLFVQPAVKDLSMAVADFTMAIAVQNLVWGFAQPLAGAWAVRYGFRMVMTGGGVLYVLGMLSLATASGYFGVMLGAGVLIGVALACVGSGMAMAVASRPVSAAQRSLVLGIVSAAGSLGPMIAAPIGQALSAGYGWRAGVFGFVALAMVIIPAAWIAGRVDKVAIPKASFHSSDASSGKEVALSAFRHAPFMIMAIAYFVCGLQLVFLTTHLPSYLALCGMDPMLSAKALATIGGFNVMGSLFFGWAGGRWSKPVLLGLIYVIRSIALGWYSAAGTMRLTRASMSEVLEAEYIKMAKIKGLPQRVIIYKHALRNACLPVITFTALQLGVLLGGAVSVEAVFAWPGLGFLILKSIEDLDYTIVQAAVTLIALSFAAINLLVDLLYAWIDPRIRYD